MGGSAPALQQPGTTANLQQAYNYSDSLANLYGSEPNQQGPYGSISTQQLGDIQVPNGNGGYFDIPSLGQTTSLSPQEQQLLGEQQQTGAIAGTEAGASLAGAGYGFTNPTTAIGDTTSGLMGGAESQFQSYEQPFFNQQTQSLQSELANQGLTPGSASYDTAMNNLMQSQGQTTSGFLSQMEPQAFSQAATEYELPLQNAGTLYQMDQPQIPGEIQYPSLNISPPNYEGDVSAYDTAEVQEYQAQQQLMGNIFAGLGNLGLSAAKLYGSSDRRLKTNCTIIGRVGKLNLWKFRFKATLGRCGGSGWQRGFMADEVAKIAPHAVRTGPTGYLMVDYAAATAAALA